MRENFRTDRKWNFLFVEWEKAERDEFYGRKVNFFSYCPPYNTHGHKSGKSIEEKCRCGNFSAEIALFYYAYIRENRKFETGCENPIFFPTHKKFALYSKSFLFVEKLIFIFYLSVVNADFILCFKIYIQYSKFSRIWLLRIIYKMFNLKSKSSYENIFYISKEFIMII